MPRYRTGRFEWCAVNSTTDESTFLTIRCCGDEANSILYSHDTEYLLDYLDVKRSRGTPNLVFKAWRLGMSSVAGVDLTRLIFINNHLNIMRLTYLKLDRSVLSDAPDNTPS